MRTIAAPEYEIDNILSYFNTFHPRLQFTVEKETNKHINFLDITVYNKNNGNLYTYQLVHQKFGVIVTTPIAYKISVTNSLVDRAYKQNSINKNKLAFEANHYPTLINKFVNKRIKQLYRVCVK